jgi:virulence-associated protein VapD
MHFRVLVVGDNPDEQLLRYRACDEPKDVPEGWLEFIEVEEEYRKRYKKMTAGKGALRRLLRRVRSALPYGRKYDKGAYPTFDDYMRGFEKNEKTGKYGYWRNPRAKCDYYLHGEGFFKLKATAEGLSPHREEHIQDEYEDEGYTDQCRIKDIDIEGMKREARERANAQYDDYEAAVRESTFLSFEKALYLSGGDVTQATRIYQDQPSLKPVVNYYIPEENPFECGREEYVRRNETNALTTFAVLKEEKWYERVNWKATFDPEWTETFYRLFDSLGPDTLVSIYDCHS